MWCWYNPSKTEIPPTWRTLVWCSEVPITGGSQQTWRCAKPHLQLLPGHRGGCLSWRLVGCLRLHVLSIVVHCCQPLQKHHMCTGGSWVKKERKKKTKKDLSQTDLSTRDLAIKISLAWNTGGFLFVILAPPPSSLAPNRLCVSQAYSTCQPMGGGRWEKPWVVQRDAGRWPACYYLPPWQLRDQVGGE